MANDNLNLSNHSDVADQLEEAYSLILEADSLINVLRASDGSVIEILEGHVQNFCDVVCKILDAAAVKVENSNRAIRQFKRGAS